MSQRSSNLYIIKLEKIRPWHNSAFNFLYNLDSNVALCLPSMFELKYEKLTFLEFSLYRYFHYLCHNTGSVS